MAQSLNAQDTRSTAEAMESITGLQSALNAERNPNMDIAKKHAKSCRCWVCKILIEAGKKKIVGKKKRPKGELAE